MKKILVLLILAFLSTSPAISQVLEGKITYTVESARVLTFEGAKMEIPVSSFQSYIRDPDYKSSLDFIKYEVKPPGRDIEVFTKGKFKLAYAVRYEDKKDIAYFYTKLGGMLVFMDIDEKNKNQKTKYPIKTYRYDTDGKLFAAGLYVSENEGFLYDKKQKLLVHRIGQYGYNEKGKKMWKAQEVEF